MKNKRNLNIEINNRRTEDVAEKLGSVFGNRGCRIGKTIDDLTKNITIKIDSKEVTNRRDDY